MAMARATSFTTRRSTKLRLSPLPITAPSTPRPSAVRDKPRFPRYLCRGNLQYPPRLHSCNPDLCRHSMATLSFPMVQRSTPFRHTLLHTKSGQTEMTLSTRSTGQRKVCLPPQEIAVVYTAFRTMAITQTSRTLKHHRPSALPTHLRAYT